VDAWVLGKAAVMGIVEGLTEFLPISSTGHLILAASLLDFTGQAVKVFEVAIQTGAMLAVIWEYRARLAGTFGGLLASPRDPVAVRFTRNVLIAFLPAVVFGLLLGSAIKAHLFHPVPVALAFVIGGVVILWVEARHRAAYGAMDLQGARHARVQTVDDMSAFDALKVGLVQCLALIPGTSRSGGDDHRRHGVRLFAPCGHRVQLLPGDPHADRRRRLLGLEGPPFALDGRHADVPRGHRVRVRIGAAVHPLADPVRVDA
jgi:undecaprenyl-diphosphatase